MRKNNFTFIPTHFEIIIIAPFIRLPRHFLDLTLPIHQLKRLFSQSRRHSSFFSNKRLSDHWAPLSRRIEIPTFLSPSLLIHETYFTRSQIPLPIINQSHLPFFAFKESIQNLNLKESVSRKQRRKNWVTRTVSRLF
jgi:hypothetical protein